MGLGEGEFDGHCLCGAVRVRARRARAALTFCHCGQCRKSAGGAFVAAVPFAATDVSLAAAPGALAAFRSSADKTRWFCRVCGTPLFSSRDAGDRLRLRVALFDTLQGVAAGAHICVASAAAWDHIGDTLPRHAGIETDRRD